MTPDFPTLTKTLPPATWTDFESWANTIKVPTSGVLVIVDDEPKVAKIEALMFQAAGFTVFTAFDGKQAMELIQEQHPDIAILDYMMPNIDGLTLMSQILAQFPDVYCIIATGKGSEEKAAEFMRAGASDYLIKPLPKPQLLRPILDRTLRLREAELKIRLYVEHLKQLNQFLEQRVLEKTEELERNNQRLQEMVNRDDLTGLYNQKTLYHKLSSEILRARRYQRPLGFIMIDLDRFKLVNDQYGHLAGSAVLKQAAQVILRSIRGVDWATRFGGDEFCVVLPEADAQGLKNVAERIRHNLETFPFQVEDSLTLKIQASLGASLLKPEYDADQLIKLADDALYRAKAAGRNRVESSS